METINEKKVKKLSTILGFLKEKGRDGHPGLLFYWERILLYVRLLKAYWISSKSTQPQSEPLLTLPSLVKDHFRVWVPLETV
jgi:hypothetical protein